MQVLLLDTQDHHACCDWGWVLQWDPQWPNVVRNFRELLVSRGVDKAEIEIHPTVYSLEYELDEILDRDQYCRWAWGESLKDIVTIPEPTRPPKEIKRPCYLIITADTATIQPSVVGWYDLTCEIPV